MKVLFIGGTGNISSAVSRLCIAKGISLYHLNRGTTGVDIPGVKKFIGDINDSSVTDELKKTEWDAVVNWVAFTEKDAERDIKLFQGRTRQYIFISSASVYQETSSKQMITESTPLQNNDWDYSKNKISCETFLMKAYTEINFPVTIVRPSHTYDTVIPIAIGGFHEFTTADRIIREKKIIVHGDGKSLWTVTHSEDFARGFTGLIGNRQALGEAFHITSDEVLTWDEIYQTLAGALGRKADMVHIPAEFICSQHPPYTGTLLGDKAKNGWFDNSKIKERVPGYQAVIPFAEGIRKTLEWFNERPDRKIIKEETNQIIDRIIGSFENIHLQDKTVSKK